MFHSTSFSRSGCLPDRTSHYSYSCNTIFLHPPPEEDVRIDQSWEEMASMNLGRNLQQPLPYIPPPVRPPMSRALEDTTALHCYFRPGVLRDGRIQEQYAGSSSLYSGAAAVAAARTTRAEGAGVGAARRSITYPLLEQNQRSEQARRYHDYHYQQQHSPPPPLLLHSTSQNPSTNPLLHYTPLPSSDTYAPRTTATRRRRRRRRDRHARKEEQQQQPPFYNDNHDDIHSTFSQINSTHSGYSHSHSHSNSNSNDKTTFEVEEVEVEEVEEEEEEVGEVVDEEEEEEPRRGRTRTRTRWGEEEEKKGNRWLPSSPSPSVSRGGITMGRTVATAVEPRGGYYYETRVVEPEWTR